MRIWGKIVIKDQQAPRLVAMITQSIEPDNLSNITTEYGEASVTTYFRADRIGSLIATVDDYIMNARIAADVLSAVDDNLKTEDDDQWNFSSV